MPPVVMIRMMNHGDRLPGAPRFQPRRPRGTGSFTFRGHCLWFTVYRAYGLLYMIHCV